MTGYPCCEHCFPPGTAQGGHGSPCGAEGCVGNTPGVLSEEGDWVPAGSSLPHLRWDGGVDDVNTPVTRVPVSIPPGQEASS